MILEGKPVIEPLIIHLILPLPPPDTTRTRRRQYALELLAHSRKLFAAEPTLQDIVIPEGHRLTLVGDLHGQLQDLFTIFTLNGLPSEVSASASALPTGVYLGGRVPGWSGGWPSAGARVSTRRTVEVTRHLTPPHTHAHI